MSVVRELPLVAIVGRPNVGKSRLFNRMTQSRHAIVEDTPGVTRDRHYGEVEWYGAAFNLVDTGGFDPGATDELLSAMREQAQIAIDEADVVLVLFDGRAGPVAADQEIVEIMRRSKKRVVYAVNKIDAASAEPLVAEFFELGAGELFPISAEHGYGVDDLMDHLTEGFPEAGAVEAGTEAEEADDAIRVAVLGRPNVGKSTLINQLLGEQRLLTSEIPGTTRDAIDSLLEWEGRRYLLIDTAGIRRRRSISLRLEKYSVVRAFSSIDRAQVVLFLIDGLEGPTDQDARLVGLAADKGRAIVLVVNKWDAVQIDENTAGRYAKHLRAVFPFCRYAPIEMISALTGKRVHRLLTAASRVLESWQRRIATAELNRFVEDVVRKRQPPVHRNRRLKLFYATQVSVGPPTFMFVCNYPRSVPTHYRRFIVNQLREAYGFEGSPIKVFFRPRRKEE